MMNRKEALLQEIIAQLAADYELVFAAARAAHEAATHEENLPDNKYDTLSLEASYIAQGQANRAQEIKAALDAWRSAQFPSFRDGSRIRLGALVTLEDEAGDERKVLLGPAAGGLKVGEGQVTVITPESPLGMQLLGKETGDAVETRTGGMQRDWEIVAVE